MSSRSFLATAICGRRVTGAMTTRPTTTTGCRARGSILLNLAFFGRRVIGAGEAADIILIKDIGARRWATTAESIIGYGYGGVGYEGGRWEGNRFLYNTSVNRVNTAVIHNTFNAPVSNASESHVSFNGGQGGVEARPTAQQEAFAKEQHMGPVDAQTQHMQLARNNPELRASANQGKPPIAATSKAGDFTSGFVAAKQAGGEYKAPLPDAPSAHGSRVDTINHASELPSHDFKAPNSGNATTDKSYQQQLNELSSRQTQDHEKLEQQQEEEHQQATQKNYSDKQIQQMEQRHSQQTEQLEQRHSSENRQMEQRQSSQSSSKSQSNSNSGKPH